ncbi:MAG TPA: alpha/beta hydrolase [Candidatus Tumulicola sp.]|jgi:acetyl esterase
MPVDPDVARLLALIEDPATPRIELLDVAEMRASETLMASWMGDPPPVAAVRHVAIPGPGGPIMARAYYPSLSGPLPLVVYFHGGGWVFGSVQNIDVPCRQLANASGWIVLVAQYRLAPEARFPSAVLDAYAVVSWALAHAESLDADPGTVAVAGDSAGGNLAAAATLLARDRGAPLPRHQLLLYPVLDSEMRGASYREFRDGYLLSTAAVARDWSLYLRDDLDRANPYAAPLLARTLRGLPPATIFTAQYDPVRDDGAEYARRLREDGVTVEYRCFDGLVHAAFQMANIGAGPRGFLDAAAGALERIAGGR